MKTNNNWIIYNKKFDKDVASKWNISPLLARILSNRDIKNEDVKYMLSEDIEDMHSEGLLNDIDKAVEVIKDAIDKNKHIRIIGDYDADGVCATYILVTALKKLNAHVDYRIPDRVKDGYGININLIEEAIKDKVELIITCDNGVAAKDEIKYAKDNNIDVIITDHHEIASMIKEAAAIVNPKVEKENKYPFKDICGATVAFKFIKKLFNEYNKKFGVEKYNYKEFIEFATIATVCDIMPITNENHILVKVGLKKISETKNKGLKKLLEINNLKDTTLTTYHLGFIIGPLINASGRLMTAELALKLFLSEDDNEIEELSLMLKDLNEERKRETKKGEDECLKKVEEEYKNDKVIVVYVEGVKESVAGIIAGHIKDILNKPAIVVTDTSEKGIVKGSCRSIDEYNIFENLSMNKELFIKFGGHKGAAGFSMKKENVDILRKKLNESCKIENIPKKIYIDAEVPIKYIDFEMVNDIEKIAPYGFCNERPLFAKRNVELKFINSYGKDKNVLRLKIIDEGVSFDAVYFIEEDEYIKKINGEKTANIIYYPTINYFNNNKKIEINIRDLKPVNKIKKLDKKC